MLCLLALAIFMAPLAHGQQDMMSVLMNQMQQQKGWGSSMQSGSTMNQGVNMGGQDQMMQQMIQQMMLQQGGSNTNMNMNMNMGGQQQGSNNQQMQMMQMMMMMNQMQSGKDWGNKQPSTPTRQNVTGCQGFADVIFMLDSSGSIGDVDFKKQLDFVSHVAGNFQLRQNGGNSGYQIGVLSFSDSVREEFPLSRFQNTAELQRAIAAIQYMGQNTNTDRALTYAKDQAFTSGKGGRYGAVKIVIVMTDGRSNVPTETERIAELVRKDNTMVVAIGIGNDVDPAELKKIASSDKNVFQVAGFDVLDTIKQAVEERACTITIEAGGAVSNNSPAFDWEQYLKWCADQQNKIKEKTEEEVILEKMESMRKEREEREKARYEAWEKEMEKEDSKESSEEEDEHSMQEKIEYMMKEAAQYNEMQAVKEALEYAYYFKVTSVMIQFCPLGKYKDSMTLFMQRDDEKWMPGKEDNCNLESMPDIDRNMDPQAIALQLVKMSTMEQTEAFFGGLKGAVCASLMEYMAQLERWTIAYPRWANMVMGL
jgi:Mg-chelatase subunit ChlD